MMMVVMMIVLIMMTLRIMTPMMLRMIKMTMTMLELTQVRYDKLLLATGPWTNSLLDPGLTSPSLSLLPVLVSNEQTQDFDAR